MTDVEAILEATVEELHRAFGYFLCAVVRDRDGRVSAAAVRGDAFLRLGLQHWSQPREEGLIGRCLRTKRPVLVDDVYDAARLHPDGRDRPTSARSSSCRCGSARSCGA